ncbi:Pentalenene synthase (plasmid) [Streptomyces sp. YIM 121038]|uniref:terpene synthase family protein n=1 Tax=Streptomyces sp. YIM 121038 TaxID=2136401 RepID=UPI0011109A87|nr:terpene synthase family protein [Streptomyces sp. YIM 121038]QCX82795.1 Pentalenene synthase [Streptomyces sp. YIM 121038]
MSSTPATSQKQEIVLAYPDEWNYPLDKRQLSPEVDREVGTWMDHLGLVSSDLDRETYSAIMGASKFALYCYPSADVDRQTVIGKMLAVWTRHDDQIEGHGISDWEADVLGRAASGDLPEPSFDNRYLHGWWEVGQAFRAAAMSPHWRQRLGTHVTAWYRGTNGEAALASRCDPPPTLDEYLPVRRGITGQTIWLHLAQYGTDRELPEHAYGTEVEEFHYLAEHFAALYNDIFTVGKDAKSNFPNAVSILAREQEISWTQAALHLADLHASTVARWSALEQTLLSTEPSLAWWVQTARNNVAGETLALYRATRYFSPPTAPDGSPFPYYPSLRLGARTVDPRPGEGYV